MSLPDNITTWLLGIVLAFATWLAKMGISNGNRITKLETQMSELTADSIAKAVVNQMEKKK